MHTVWARSLKTGRPLSSSHSSFYLVCTVSKIKAPLGVRTGRASAVSFLPEEVV